MRLPLLPLLASLGLATTANSLAKVHYVDGRSINPVPPYTDWSTAATNIQDAIDVALAGEQVLVRKGLYASGGRAVSGTTINRAAIDRAISVASVNGPAVTVIEGAPADGGAIRCAYVGANAVLSGFTLTNGWTSESGGGVWCDPGGIVTNCVITGNTASMEGGGAWFGTLYNCVLNGNRAEYQGGGVYFATLHNCTLTGNSAGYEGGGACFSDLYNCTLTGNAADEGGGTAAGRLYNCIAWFNTAHWGANFGTAYDYIWDEDFPPMLAYCCTSPAPANGVGNLLADPQLASGTHVSAMSPCIGAGISMVATGVDIDGEPWLDPPCIGADQYVAGQASGALTAAIEAGYTNVATDFPVSFTGKIAGRTTGSAWDFGDGTVVSNRPYATHAWRSPGTFRVTLTAFNDSFPGGVNATQTVEVSGVTYYVDPSSATPVYPYTKWQTAARTIQEAVEAGDVPGRLILVTNGVYSSGSVTVAGMQNRMALLTPAMVASVNGPSVTRIEGAAAPGGGNGEDAIRCAYVGAGAVLSGFTLTNGHTRAYAAGLGPELLSGGGVWCEYGGLVTNCVFVGNMADNVGGGGGGAYGGRLESCVLSGGSAYSGGGACSSTLCLCTITGNTAMEGGGVAGGSLTNCTLSQNHADHRGGGANGGLLKDCTVAGNSAAEGGGVFAGTLFNCAVTNNSAVDSSGGAGVGILYNSIVSGNSAYQGGGASGCVLYNCTVTGNSAYRGGGASWGVRLYNCILYYNEAPLGSNYEPEGVDFNFSCTTPLPAGGMGNIADEPQLASLTHLSVASPCIGMGSAEYASGVDVDGEPWPNPPSMGADQYVAGGATGALTVAISGSQAHIASGSPLALTAEIDGPTTASEWDFGDGTFVRNRPYVQHTWLTPGRYTVRLTAYNDSFPEGVSATALVLVSEPQIYYVNQANATPLFPYTTWASAAPTIQEAVNAAQQGDTVLVTNGVYASGGCAVSGTLTNRVAVLRPLRLASVNGPSVTVIQGTAANGAHGNGDSAVRCVYLCAGAVLSGFTLTNGHTRAYAPGLGPDLLGGGGVWCQASAVVTNCVITGSSADGFGGGAYSGIFYRSKLSSNNVIGQGGGVFRGWLYDCELTGNGWSVYGGGAYESTLYNCSLSGNSASGGGGAFSATLYNCVLSRNVAGYGGGADSSLLYNCTVTGNSADQSGGVESSELYNCIVYYNTAPVGANYSVARTAVENSCTTPLPALGNGNITNEPSFLDQSGGNLRLTPDSPCMNAGCNAYVFTGTDADGNPRIRGGTVDMGAYEFQTPSTVISVAWLQYYGLPIDGSADYADPDHDGMNNWQEWRAGTDPTDAMSVLRLVSASAALPGVTLTWESVSNRSYFLERSGNLGPPVFAPVATNIAGQAGVTSYTDDTATGSGPFFYRVGVE